MNDDEVSVVGMENVEKRDPEPPPPPFNCREDRLFVIIDIQHTSLHGRQSYLLCVIHASQTIISTAKLDLYLLERLSRDVTTIPVTAAAPAMIPIPIEISFRLNLAHGTVS